jgi:predicted AlkP superfamily phosphohydrolase/phosphomutase
MGNRVVVIGLDGATFHVLEPLMQQGVMPCLARLAAEGTRAGLRTIVPALTPPAWTSLMTGRSPGHHGIFDFFRMDSRRSRHIRFTTSHDVACETIWAAASRQGRRVTTLNFPLMFPAPPIEGNVVAGWVPWKQLRLACHPGDLFDRLRALPGFDQRELAMDIKLEERATEGANPDEYAPWIELHIRREAQWLAILRHLMETDPCALTAVLFDGVDKLQHLCWRFIDADPATEWSEPWERRAFDLCREYFRRLDGIIGEICTLAGSAARIFIASDHGFGPTLRVFHVNTWLAEQGYLAWSASHASDDEPALLGVGRVARHTFEMDWTRTRAFATTPTSNGIFITGRDDTPAGQAEALAIRDRIADELRRLRDPQTGRRVVRQVYTREAAFAGPFAEMAPDLTLELYDGGLFSILKSDAVFSERPTVAGAHRPVGVFIAKGPGIRAGVQSPELSILDVAPTVLYSLGLPVGSEMEGAVPDSVFEEGVLERQPVAKEKGGGAPAAPGAAPAAVLDAEQEALVMRRLQELGYVE